MTMEDELARNVKACICRRLRELNVTVDEFVRKSGVPRTMLVSALRGSTNNFHDLQEVCSRLLLATIAEISPWDHLTRRIIFALVIHKSNDIGVEGLH
jgi:predicted transcriptional regulator